MLGRKTFEWRWAGLGLAGALALYAPFLVYHAREAYHDSVAASSSSAPDAIHRFQTSVHFMLSISGGDYLSFLLGSQSGLARPVSLVLGPAAFVGLLAACRHWRSSPTGSLRLLVVAWSCCRCAALTVLPFYVYIHYFIILFPLPFLGMAYVLEWLTQHLRPLGWLALGASLCSFAVLDGQIYRTVVHDGGAPGDYGVAYKYKAAAASLIESENHGRQFKLGTDVALDPGNLDEFDLLVWTSSVGDARSKPAVNGYAIIDTMGGAPPQLPAAPNGAPYPTRQFGPLELVSVPLK